MRPVFVAARTELLGLLGDLSCEQWAAPTMCPGSTVRDVALHLLHDDLRRLVAAQIVTAADARLTPDRRCPSSSTVKTNAG